MLLHLKQTIFNCFLHILKCRIKQTIIRDGFGLVGSTNGWWRLELGGRQPGEAAAAAASEAAPPAGVSDTAAAAWAAEAFTLGKIPEAVPPPAACA